MKSSRGWIVLAILLSGCSENVGPAPPDGGTRVALRVEVPTGPVLPRAGTVVVARGRSVWWGTDAGLHRFDLEAPAGAGLPLHAGFFTSDGTESVGRVDHLAVAADGGRVIFSGRRTIVATLGVSEDGGRSFAPIDRPDATDFEVDAVGIAPPSPDWPAGAWLVAQGLRIAVREVGTQAWDFFDVPGSVRRVDAFAPDRAGGILVGVITPSDSTAVLRFDGAPEGWERVGTSDGDAVLALAGVGDAAVWAGPTGVHRRSGPVVTWTGRTLRHAALRAKDTSVDWVVASDADTPGSSRVARGAGAAVLGVAAGLQTSREVEGLSLVDGAVWWVDGTAAIVRWTDEVSRVPFPGTVPGLSTVGALDAGRGTIAVARQLNGEVFVGPSDDPAAFASRGARSNSTVRALVADPADPRRLLAASFGVYENTGTDTTWIGRNIGFTPYEIFLGDRITVITLDVLSDGALWCGGENGEGPYRWNPVTLRWDRPHDGLGIPRTTPFGALESGLPYVTQVRDFARGGDGAVWMAGFRGGVWRRDEDAGRWVGENVGLPDLGGAAMDTCCVVAPARQVDARAVVRADGGTLLAATAWGVHARTAAADVWEERSLGLTNRDVRALAVHPRDARTVVAVARGSTDAPDWLFVTEDAGRTWFPVATSRLAVPAADVVWSHADRREIVVLVEGRGAWRMELEP